MNYKKISENKLFVLLLILVPVLIYDFENIYYDYKVIITNFIILLMSLLFMVIGDNYNFSLNKMFYLFSFFFFGIAPILQYQNQVVFWSHWIYSSEDYYKMNIIIILILIIYQLFYTLLTESKKGKVKDSTIVVNKKKISIKRLVVISLLSLIITLIAFDFNLFNVFIRGGETVFSKQSIDLIYSYFLRPIPVISLFIFKRNKIEKRKIEIILWIIALITNFPTSAPRFYIGALYIPLLVVYLKKTNKKYLYFNKLMMVIFMFGFPFLDQFRKLDNIKEFTVLSSLKMFQQGHFDSYQMFMHVVTEDVVTYGKQLLTVFLFFIPRNIWPGKSIGSGAYIADKYDFYFSNISMNFFGEAYINFGYVGIILFVVMLSYINSQYDYYYWENTGKNKILNLFYPFLIGFQFFILRGDLLTGISSTLGVLLSLIIINNFITEVQIFGRFIKWKK